MPGFLNLVCSSYNLASLNWIEFYKLLDFRVAILKILLFGHFIVHDWKIAKNPKSKILITWLKIKNIYFEFIYINNYYYY